MQRKPLLLATLPAVLAGGLIGGCSTGDDSPPSPTTAQTSTAPSEQSDPSQSPSVQPTGEETADTTESVEGNFAGAITAAHLAMGQVENSIVTEVDSEERDTLWEIDLIGPDGKEYDITISADGSEIVKPLAEDSTSDKDRTQNIKRLDRIAVDFEQALQITGDQFQHAVLDEIDLGLDNDVLRWEVELDDDQGVSKEFDIDAATGEISNQR